MLGRMLQRSSDGVMIYESAEYHKPVRADYGQYEAKSVSAPSTSSIRPYDPVELLISEARSKHIRAIGRLQRQSPTRTNISYAMKELARRLSAPIAHNEK